MTKLKKLKGEIKMKSLTKQERICNSLIRRGFTEVSSKTKKARTFHGHHTPTRMMFVGKRGSVRTGTCYSKSIPISSKLIEILARG